MRKAILAATMIAFTMTAAPAFSAPCKDAKGKFVKCPAPHAKKCRLNGKFAACTTKGAKPM